MPSMRPDFKLLDRVRSEATPPREQIGMGPSGIQLLRHPLDRIDSAGLSIVGAWPRLGVAALLLGPIGGAVACAASAIFPFISS